LASGLVGGEGGGVLEEDLVQGLGAQGGDEPDGEGEEDAAHARARGEVPRSDGGEDRGDPGGAGVEGGEAAAVDGGGVQGDAGGAEDREDPGEEQVAARGGAGHAGGEGGAGDDAEI